MLPRSRTLPPRMNHGAIEERQDITHYMQVEIQHKAQSETEAINPQSNYSKCFDDDGRLKRTGTFWTATSHIITAVIGSGVLSLAWAIAQLGWVAGPIVMLLFAIVILYTSGLLSECYRTGDPVTGPRSYTLHGCRQGYLRGRKVKVCGAIQYMNLFGTAIGYTIAASVSMMAIKRSNCFHKSGGKDPCHMSSNGYMITFGITEILFSQIPDFDQVWWLSIVAAVMSFTYSIVGLSLGIAKVAGKHCQSNIRLLDRILCPHSRVPNQLFKTHGKMDASCGQEKWELQRKPDGYQHRDNNKSRTSNCNTEALEESASSWSYCICIFLFHHPLRNPVFYLLCGCMGYAAFGDNSPGNLLTGFGFYNPYWLLDIANLAIVIHLVGAYQGSMEDRVRGGDNPHSHAHAFLQRCRWTSRSLWVLALNSLLSHRNVHVSEEDQTVVKQVDCASNTKPDLSLSVSIAAAVGSVAGVLLDLKTYKPFKTSY
ncbi:amino acid permease 2 [Actinidia rufa]|uniref:Amino acid permease 2 n=1 Tax=Actinidia rufa TaxID=165716 RepID=A0A7J0ETM9_9ERIC|nr:amino acid permease 2 [Actinidia rufa]